MIFEGSKHSGILASVEEEGENYYVIRIGQASIGVPRKVRTRGGYVDLMAWVGQEIEVCCYGGKVSARLLPLDEQQMRIWELEELVARYLTATGVNIPLNEAMEVLGTSVPDLISDTGTLRQFFKYSSTRHKRTQALSAVVA
jgi:antitoxin (DNA-binding transcriptional repressor) of toxin-antitoxin stability system